MSQNAEFEYVSPRVFELENVKLLHKILLCREMCFNDNGVLSNQNTPGCISATIKYYV